MGNCLRAEKPKHTKMKQLIFEESDEGLHHQEMKEESGCMKGYDCMGSTAVERGHVRVKILLTKKELSLLLSKCSDDNNEINGGMSERIARELKVKADDGRIRFESVQPLKLCSDSWRPALDSIPEDC
ncbi:hypothetical protein QJS10_CPB20g02006 [Acorus calamus]|uniref:DUF7890 domain-containing protein n=1 Tax=Acorus calamus TaxID=4465 RepID=A0AAV9C987_ACOCL|nr:hypothetical protein QJS10_CPB20g02006 [Acorus calamus]